MLARYPELLVPDPVPKNLTRTESWFWNRVDTKPAMEGSVLRTRGEWPCGSSHLSNWNQIQEPVPRLVESRN